MKRILKYIFLIGVFWFGGHQAYQIYQQEVVGAFRPSGIELKDKAPSQRIDTLAVATHHRKSSSLATEMAITPDGPKNTQRHLMLTFACFFCLLVYAFYFTRKSFLQNKECSALRAELDKTKETLEEKRHTIIKEMGMRKQAEQTLFNALGSIKEVNSLKEAFLSNISHEIRTPLNGIIGFSNLMKEEAHEIGHSRMIQQSQFVVDSGERLLNFLNNVIDISRIEANELNIKEEVCDLTKIVNQVCNAHRFSMNEKSLGLELFVADHLKVEANTRYLTKVIGYIIDNAIKYTENGAIKVSAFDPVGSQYAILCIEDTGIGIDPEYMQHIFEAFRQESSGMTRCFEGGGLALPLAKKFLDLMGGKIEIASEKGIGTQVKILLRKPEEISVPEFPAHQTSEVVLSTFGADKGQTILLVEDDSINGELIEAYLQGYAKIIVSKDGNIAQRQLEEFHREGKRIDLFLMDINLPQGWNGIDLMHEIKRRWTYYEKTPFVAQTAYAMKGDRDKLLSEGFDDYISKPINKKSLIACLNKHIVRKLKLQ